MAKNPLSTSLTGPNANAPSGGAKGAGLRTLKIQTPTLVQARQAPKATPAPVLQDPQAQQTQAAPTPMKKGGMTASKRADGCCVRGKTKA